jgi:hypothetical protein
MEGHRGLTPAPLSAHDPFGTRAAAGRGRSWFRSRATRAGVVPAPSEHAGCECYIVLCSQVGNPNTGFHKGFAVPLTGASWQRWRRGARPAGNGNGNAGADATCTRPDRQGMAMATPAPTPHARGPTGRAWQWRRRRRRHMRGARPAGPGNGNARRIRKQLHA